MTSSSRMSLRRIPSQARSRQTVENVLEAVQVVVKRHGVDAINTNLIAEVAGVSVGSLYQYFSDKQDIIVELHNRHVSDVRRAIAAARLAYASLDEFVAGLIEGLVEVHSQSAEVHELLLGSIPGSAYGFRRALHITLKKELSLEAAQDMYSFGDRQKILVLLPHILESIIHENSHSRDGPTWKYRGDIGAINSVLRYVDTFHGSRRHA